VLFILRVVYAECRFYRVVVVLGVIYAEGSFMLSGMLSGINAKCHSCKVFIMQGVIYAECRYAEYILCTLPF
jgi:ABC-type xylose transport system permease subunit